jgi:hypothetical protein
MNMTMPRPLFDPKSFLAKVGEDRSIGSYADLISDRDRFAAGFSMPFSGLIPTPPAQRFSDYSENSSIMMIITTQTPGSFGVNNCASVSPNFNRSNGFCNTGKLW